jgi:hypothetical protein
VICRRRGRTRREREREREKRDGEREGESEGVRGILIVGEILVFQDALFIHLTLRTRCLAASFISAFSTDASLLLAPLLQGFFGWLARNDH